MSKRFIIKTIFILIVFFCVVAINSFIRNIGKNKKSNVQDSVSAAKRNEQAVPVEMSIRGELMDKVTKLRASETGKEIFDTDLKIQIEGGTIYSIYIPNSKKHDPSMHIENIETLYNGEYLSITGTYSPDNKQIILNKPLHKLRRIKINIELEGDIADIDDNTFAYCGTSILTLIDSNGTRYGILGRHPATFLYSTSLNKGIDIGDRIRINGFITLKNGKKYIFPNEINKISAAEDRQQEQPAD